MPKMSVRSADAASAPPPVFFKPMHFIGTTYNRFGMPVVDSRGLSNLGIKHTRVLLRKQDSRPDLKQATYMAWVEEKKQKVEEEEEDDEGNEAR